VRTSLAGILCIEELSMYLADAATCTEVAAHSTDSLAYSLSHGKLLLQPNSRYSYLVHF